VPGWVLHRERPNERKGRSRRGGEKKTWVQSGEHELHTHGGSIGTHNKEKELIKTGE